MNRLRIREFTNFEGLHTIEKGTGWLRAIRIAVYQRAGFSRGMPLLATGHAGMAANAGIEIDDQSELCHFVSPRTNDCHLPRAGSIPGTLCCGVN